MPEIKIKVRDKCAEGEGVVICNNSDYTVAWDLDGEWTPYDTKTMRVNLTDGGYQDVVFTGNTAALPVLSTPGWVSVGLYAGDLHTSRAARFLALSSVLTPGGSPAAPAEDVYAQIMAKLNELSTVSPEDIAKAVEDYLAEHPAASASMRVEGGYIQFSADGKSWENVIALADLKGAPGADGITPHIGDNGNWYLGDEDTGNPSRGAPGAKGPPGKDGAGMDVTGATVGQTVKIAAVDDNGVPTAWSPVDMPSGGSETWELLSDNTIDDDVSYIAMETPPCKRIRAYFDGHQVFSDGSETSTNFTSLVPEFDVDDSQGLYAFYVLNDVSRFNSDVVSVIDFDVSTPPFASGSMHRIFPNGQNTYYASIPVSNEIAITDMSAITQIKIHPKYKFVQGQGSIGRFASGGRLRIYGVRK